MKKITCILPGLIFLLLFLSCLSGCGKTGDPRPMRMTVTAAKGPSMLSLDQSGCGVILMWTLGEDKSVPETVKIYRSDFNVAEGDCKDCPGTRNLVAELSREQLSYIREYDGSYVYFDKTVQKDFVYKYVMVVCSGKGSCSEPSGESEIRFTYSMDNCP